ncbi:MAG TPA: helix-turn-helix transcriptional regulator [Ktedonobacterales bacterium]
MLNKQESNRFGSRVRWLRESFYLRTSKPQSGDPVPNVRLSGLALIECLSRAEFTMSSGQLSDIEAGRNMPRDIEGFLRAISKCLRLDAELLELLRTDFAFDLVAKRFGTDFAERSMRPLTCVGQTVRHFRREAGLAREQLAELMIESGFRPARPDTLSKLTEQLALIEQGDDSPCEGDGERIGFLVHFGNVLGEEARGALVLARISDRLEPVSAADLKGGETDADISPDASPGLGPDIGPLDRAR